jgi:hypothetical protein
LAPSPPWRVASGSLSLISSPLLYKSKPVKEVMIGYCYQIILQT